MFWNFLFKRRSAWLISMLQVGQLPGPFSSSLAMHVLHQRHRLTSLSDRLTHLQQKVLTSRSSVHILDCCEETHTAGHCRTANHILDFCRQALSALCTRDVPYRTGQLLLEGYNVLSHAEPNTG